VDAIPDEVKHIVTDSEASFVVAKDQEQVDKVLEIRDLLPRVKKVIYWDEKGMWNYNDPYVLSFQAVKDLGKEYERSHSGLFEEEIAKGTADDVCLLSYTSGTTGLPKGVVIQYGTLMPNIIDLMNVVPWQEGENYLSYVSPAWVTEHGWGFGAGIMIGAVINFPEEPETLDQDIREIAPLRLLYTSRLWESMASTIRGKMDDADFIKASIYNLFLPVGYKMADAARKGLRADLFTCILNKIGDWVVFYPLRDKLGLSHTRYCFTGGAPTSPDIFYFLYALGIKLRQQYGSTEAYSLTGHSFEPIRFDTLGQILPGVELRIANNAELLARRHGGMFKEYYKDPEKTAKVWLDGWYRTGDACNIDANGELVYLDRCTEMLELAGGETFPPQYIENKLKFSKYIKDCIILGGKEKPFVSVIAIIDFDIVSRWAEKKHLTYTTFTDLSQKPDVYGLIEKEIRSVNKNLPAAARVVRFTLLPKELDPDEAELTRTRKLRRSFVDRKYSEVIDAIYGDKSEFLFNEEVKYRDGRSGKINTTLTIVKI
jgi:long-chain acyl-CoA synthetase